MFFLILIVLLILFHTQSAQVPVGQLWFMLSVFAGLAYVAGFLDSRLFSRLDRNKGNMLAEAEARYEQHFEKEASESSQPLNP
jgi:membrane protein implicated in regulation of membrane protease activity